MRCPWGGTAAVWLLHAAFTARGETVALPPAHSAGGPYGSFADNTFPDAAFAAIHTRPLPRNQKPVRGEYTQTTVLGDMLDSRTGRALHALACARAAGHAFFQQPGGEPPGVRDDGTRPAV